MIVSARLRKQLRQVLLFVQFDRTVVMCKYISHTVCIRWLCGLIDWTIIFAVKKNNITTNESTIKTASSHGALRAFTILCYLWLIKVFGSIGWLCVCSDAF